MNKEYQPIPERGLLNLINQKLEAGNDLAHIKDMLIRAGLDEEEVQRAIHHAAERDTTRHQREAEMNDFLPPLKKTDSKIGGMADSIVKVVSAELGHKGLFRGRLRRKDFIIGILFFFGLGFILANVALSWIQFFAPLFAERMMNLILLDSTGAWLLFVPFVFAPITLIILSLITRRLHNLGFPGWMSLLFLVAFVSPFGAIGGYLLLGFHFMLLTLFIVLMTVKGHPEPNKHGELPPSSGSIFGRVLGES